MTRNLSSLVVLGLVFGLAACGGPAPDKASKQDGGKMSSENMPMKKDGMMGGPSSAATTGTASGVVTAVDTAAGTVTIQHGPIPAVKWPAMTMEFKADPTSVLNAVKVGDQVEFDMNTEGNRVTAIRPQ